MKYHVLTASVMLAAAVPAVQAEDFKPYAGIGMGVFGLEYSEPGLSQRNSVFGGFGKFGVDINDYVGVELRLGMTGKGKKTYPAAMVNGATQATELAQQFSSFFSYLGKLQYPVAENTKVYGLIGGTTARYKHTYTPANAVIGSGQSASKTSLSFGFGGERFINDQVSIGAEWMQYWTSTTLNAATGAKAKLWGASGTLNYYY